MIASSVTDVSYITNYIKTKLHDLFGSTKCSIALEINLAPAYEELTLFVNRIYVSITGLNK